VLDVARAPQVLVLHHEQYVPAELLPHETDDAPRHIRIGVNAGLAGDLFEQRPQL
jgi:hypothetical protein